MPPPHLTHQLYETEPEPLVCLECLECFCVFLRVDAGGGSSSSGSPPVHGVVVRVARVAGSELVGLSDVSLPAVLHTARQHYPQHLHTLHQQFRQAEEAIVTVINSRHSCYLGENEFLSEGGLMILYHILQTQIMCQL